MFSHRLYLFTTFLLVGILVFTSSVPVTAADTIFLPVIQTDHTSIGIAEIKPPRVVIRLAPDVTVETLGQDYPLTVVGGLAALGIYSLENVDASLLDRLRTDPRLVSVETDDQFVAVEARQRTFTGTGSDFQALQRYFGSGSGDSPELASATEKKAKKNRKKKSADNLAEQVLVTTTGQVLNADWQTWAERGIHLKEALKRYTGAGITVAVLDTGVAATHPLLANHLSPGYDFVANDALPEDAIDGVDEDADGLIDEGAGHGTHIAGIIAAVAPQAKILPVRVLNSDGGGTLFAIVQGVVFAVDNGAQVINLSLSTVSNSPALEAVIHYALERQVIVVAAASGDSTGLDYPAAYDQVIAVGATSKDNRVTGFSTPYASMVDVFAPGDYIYSTYRDGNFAWWSGTSMSAPFVAGGAALLLSSGRCSSACTQDLITNKVENVSKVKGIGRVNLDKAVKGVD